MDNSPFSSFNFPYTPSTDSRQSFSTYGSTGPLFLFKDERENTIRYVPQKKGNAEKTRVRLIAKKPTLPLKASNKVCWRFNCEKNDQEKLWSCNRNLTNLLKDYGDVVNESLLKLIGEEVEKLQWRLPTSYLMQKRKTQWTPFYYSFCDDVYDIPLEMLDDLFKESYVDDNFEFTGKYFGNCLVHHVNMLSTDPTVVLAHPCGELMDKVSFSSLQFHSDDDGQLSSKLLPGKHTFNFPNRIRQISTTNQGQSSSSVMAVRTDYSCSFIKLEYNHDYEPMMSIVENLACKTKPCSVTVNPFIPGEVIIAMETGSLCSWSENASLQVLKKCSACVPEDFDWYFCEFGPHPRQILYCNKTNVELLDLRDSSCGGKDMMTAPSPYLLRDDQFSAVQRHPENPYHYFLGTNHSLLIMDERFPNNPVLKWHHSLGEPIKHLDVVTNAFPGSKDILLVCGGYQSHDIHCYQYCHGENLPYSLGMLSNMGGLPPQSTSSPWKISSYNEWPEMVDFPNKAEIWSTVVRQLNQPLLGLACLLNPSPPNKNLAILQMSKVGDLFYQCFTPCENALTQEVEQGRVYFYEDMNMDLASSGGCSGRKPVLTEKDRHVLENWLECVKQKKTETNASALQESSSTFNFSDAAKVYKNLFSKLENGSKCRLCDDVGSSRVDTVQKMCDSCGVDRNDSKKLSSARTKEMTVLTNAFLGNSYVPKELELFDKNSNYTDPLGATLLKNWYNEEQTPVNLGEESQDAMTDENASETQDPNKKDPDEIPLFKSVTQNHSSHTPNRESAQISEKNSPFWTSIERKDNSMLAKGNGFSVDLGIQLSSPRTPTRTSGVKRKHARVAGF